MKKELSVAVIQESYVQNLIVKFVYIVVNFLLFISIGTRMGERYQAGIKSQTVAILSLNGNKQFSFFTLVFFSYLFTHNVFILFSFER